MQPSLLTLRTRFCQNVVTLALTLGSLLGFGQAADLVTWDVNPLVGGVNNYGTSPLPATTSGANLTVVGLTRGGGVSTTGTAAAKAWGGLGWNVVDKAAAIAGNKFATFSVTPNAGFQVSFTSISKFDYRRSSTGASAGVLQVDVGGGGFSDVATLAYPTTASAGDSVAPIDLTVVPALQKVTPSTVVTFRIVNFGGTSAAGTWYIYNKAGTTASDFTVTGTVTPFTTDPDLTVTKSHTDTFTQGDIGRTYNLLVNNVGVGATTGTVTVTDTLPTGLTATAMSGTGWTIDLPTLTATRSDALPPASSYDPLTVTVSVAANAPASVTNLAIVSGGGETNSGNDTANDPTIVSPLVADLTISKSHTDTFTQGDTGRTYTLNVSNVGNSPTSGTVTVTDTLPTGLTATAMSGTGWTIDLLTRTATRSSALVPGSAYPPITVTVSVAANAPVSVTNVASVSGGGDASSGNNTANDPTTIITTTPSLTITASPTEVLEGNTISATVSRPDLSPAPMPEVTVNLLSNDTTEATVLATTVILAGDTAALFDVTGVLDGIHDGDQLVTITASATGFTSGTINITVKDIDPAPPVPATVVINKYYNSGSASGDKIELLVIGNGTPGSTVDLTGMIVKDFSGSMGGDGGGKFQFKADSHIQAVKAGTLIVLTSGTNSSPDTDASDFSLQLGLTDTTFFTSLGGSFDIAATEMVSIKAAGSVTADAVGAIHSLAGGVAGVKFTGAPSPKLVASGTSATGRVVFANNSTSSLADFNGTDATGADATLVSSFGLANNSTNLIYIRQLRGVTSIDGTGSASIVNATPSSPLITRNIFDRSQTAQVVAVTVTGGVPSPALNSFKVTVPAEFGVPTVPNCTVTGTGAGTPVISVRGQDVTVTGVTVDLTNPATLQIAGLLTPNPTAVTDDGRYLFVVKTAGPIGIPTAITASPSAIVIIPISALRDVNASGVPLDKDKIVAVSGVVTEENFLTSQTSGFLQDGDYGICVFTFNPAWNLVRDHRFVVSGTILQFGGLTELSPASLADSIDLGSALPPTSFAMTATQIAAPASPLDVEPFEGRLVTLTGLTYVSGTWGSAQDVVLTDGAGHDVKIRISAGSAATTPPNYPVTITSVLSQAQTPNTAPFTSGYDLLPRSDADVVGSAVNNYAAWAATHWPGETDPTIIGFDADPEKDGIINGIEHALGLDPKAPSPDPYFTLVGVGNVINFSHPRTKSLGTDVTLNYEWSTDLGSWNASGVDVGGVSVTFTEDSVNTSGPDYDVVSSHATLTGSPAKVFLHFRANK